MYTVYVFTFKGFVSCCASYYGVSSNTSKQVKVLTIVMGQAGCQSLPNCAGTQRASRRSHWLFLSCPLLRSLSHFIAFVNLYLQFWSMAVGFVMVCVLTLASFIGHYIS